MLMILENGIVLKSGFIIKNKIGVFKHEMIKYCRADVELISKTLLKLREKYFTIN